MSKLSLSEAKRLSIIKWTILRDHADVPYSAAKEHFPLEVQGLIASCGFCERHLSECGDCEFGAVAGICASTGSLYKNYWQPMHASYKAKVAQDIINIINEIKDEQ